jgi:hypothetical protein
MRLRYSWVAMLAVILSIVSCSCTPRLAVVPPEDVPAVFREWVTRWRSDVTNVTWRACYEQDDQNIAVETFQDGGGLMPPMVFMELPRSRGLWI